MPFIPDFIPAVGDIDAFIKVCHFLILEMLVLTHLLNNFYYYRLVSNLLSVFSYEYVADISVIVGRILVSS